jgi:hypothetical protein
MAAFDLTTKPTSLTLKPGATGNILVVVSNRLGRPVTGMVEATITPASATRWLVSPSDLLRRFEADPAATVSYEFKVAVPPDTPAQAVQFKASVRDSLAPDDSRVDGQTVAINVTPDSVEAVRTGLKLPWLVWLIAAVVIVGAGVGIYLACCANEKKVDVIELRAEDVDTTIGVLGPPLNPWTEFEALTTAWRRMPGDPTRLEIAPLPPGESRRVAQWEFDAKRGQYRLVATYANGSGTPDDRALDVVVNGETVLHGKFVTPTGGWLPKDRITEAIGEVRLKSGKNIIAISCPAARDFPHVGSLKLQYSEE